ncbi:uncharacterized protein LOC105702220 isoform X2 [Orussus abietinus]|uniref:uncharacterized protein LOC105702220 isoform X2 n=1 Tax=Orussus abietinus TaxID=222816 RepID=UPI000625201D|nr:uncharacterized protein LOC105702220 isoform X2 [Orussus abietinus]
MEKMNKDTSQLDSVNKLFTEKTLEEILEKATGKPRPRILGWSFGGGFTKGDNYLSTVNRITVKGIVENEEVEVKLVVKSLPQNLGRRNTFRSTEFFYNEIIFYEKIIPEFEKFVKSKGQAYLLCVPRCLASHLDGQNDYIALEDVSPLGFTAITRQSCLNFEECKAILEALARFHSISLAYKNEKPDTFKEIAHQLNETYYHSRLWYWYEKFHSVLVRIAKDAVHKEYPGSKVEKRFNEYTSEQLFLRSVELCGRIDAPTSVISQGDSWGPNFLIRKTPENTQEVLMLDFQLARCASPVLDISFFIYSCTDKNLRDEHFDDLLEVYHAELTKSITLLGSNPATIYPTSIFLQEVKEQFIHGFTFALESVTFGVLDETFDLDVIAGDKRIDIADVWKLSNIKSQEGRQRLSDVILHAVEREFI